MPLAFERLSENDQLRRSEAFFDEPENELPHALIPGATRTAAASFPISARKPLDEILTGADAAAVLLVQCSVSLLYL